MTLQNEVRPPVEALLRPAEVAELLGISVKQLVRLRKMGQGPRCIQLTERAYRYPVSDLRHYLDLQRRGDGHK